ncbi:MAG: hypothetical protein PHQ09_03305 [Actinomycetota bacterium]|nr:hypothetical protein [Actinomycetota bacterium]
MHTEKDPIYNIDKDGKFVIENYNHATTFSSFLPAVSGLYGKPLWAFYVNRGQCISSIGINNKDYSIMEFEPANKAYRGTSLHGFRTFLKIKDGRKVFHYEPFQNNYYFNDTYNISQKMYINSYDLGLEEINTTLGIKIEVMFCTLPGETLASLIRRMDITNISGKSLEIEIVDGLPIIIPYYLTNDNLKNESNLRQAWMGVENYKTIPFYKIEVLPHDTPETLPVEGGNFYLNFFFNKDEKIDFLKTIVEPRVIFGYATDLIYPEKFFNEDFSIPEEQVSRGTTPCGFGYKKIILGSGKSNTTYTMVGNSDNYKKLKIFVNKILCKKYVIEKIDENKKLIEGLKSPIFCSSNSKEFNLYCGQTFMDNFLRGGYPVELGKGKHIFYVYSRKHGDLEREYNFFQVDATNFSQGNSNFRDVCQNRRNDIFFFPFTDDTNIKIFFNIIQLDGFNPLVLRGSMFKAKNKRIMEGIISKYIKKNENNNLKEFLTVPFTPGSLLGFIESEEINLDKNKYEEFLNEILAASNKEDIAEFQEGYWVDHWTYNNDLLEQYISVFPDKAINLLFNKNDFTFFDTAEFVVPRERKYVLTGRGVRQLNSVIKIPEKEEMIKKRTSAASVMRIKSGKGEIYKCTLLSKIICLIINKVASLDPEGAGIEMEADKPGWCDALNGLPGILGSSINESAEVKRLALILLDVFDSYKINMNNRIKVPEEVFLFYGELESLFNKNISKYEYWDMSHKAKENFRQNTIFGISGKEEKIGIGMLISFLKAIVGKIDCGLRKAYNRKSGVYYTYFINEVVDYKILTNKNGDTLKNEDGYPYIKPLKFKQRPIPYFLEGPVHFLRVEKDIKKARKLYYSIKNTGLYDNKLGMYVVNDYIMNETKEIGRQNIFPRGWLENEAVFLHMEYKYLLELLKCGLYEEFFHDFKKVLVPFFDPAVYGRSILENSTFIVSTAHADKKIHGKGYVSRLSGSSAEFLSMWLLMTAGRRPFYLDDLGNLCLEFKPVLPGWLFTNKPVNVEIYKETGKEMMSLARNTFAFNFLGKTLVTYHNKGRKDTFGKSPVSVNRITLYKSGKITNIRNNVITIPYSQYIRDGAIDRIDILLK